MLWSWRGLSGLHWVWRNGRGPHLKGRQEPQLPLLFRLRPSELRVPAELGQESQASSRLRKGAPLACRVVQGISGPSSSCVWNLREFPDNAWECQCPFVLCLPPQGCLQRGVRASGSFQERTGKSGSFGMWQHPRGSSRISS